MKVYEDEEAAEIAPSATQTSAAAPATAPGVNAGGGRTDANGVPISNWRYFWSGENWHRGRSQNAGENAGGDVEMGQRQMQTQVPVIDRGNLTAGQAEQLEMARWQYFARTRR